ncbi:MAG: hypothetical protein QJR00_05870 [Bacillota bacterium]|nr:hypothetical protein [Bacillota bacterium]
MKSEKDIFWAQASIRTPSGWRWFAYQLVPYEHDVWILRSGEWRSEEAYEVALKDSPALWSFWIRVIREWDPVLPVHVGDVASDWPCLEVVATRVRGQKARSMFPASCQGAAGRD